MAGTRLGLHDALKAIVPNVYYNPPETVKMKYPCIIYSLDDDSVRYASDSRYSSMNRYKVTLIGAPVDSSYRDILLSMQYCTFDREYIVNNLYHDIFTIFY